MLPDEEVAALLWDMANACRSVERFIRGKIAQDIADDDLLRSAVHWQVIVLGEAAHRIRRSYRDAATDIDRVMLVRRRNLYAHDYDEANPTDLWTFVTGDLPGMAVAIERRLAAALRELGDGEPEA